MLWARLVIHLGICMSCATYFNIVPDPVHPSRQRWSLVEDASFRRISWISNSLDLNLIGHVWDVLDQFDPRQLHLTTYMT